jgi:uncharacterized protein DUF4124
MATSKSRIIREPQPSVNPAQFGAARIDARGKSRYGASSISFGLQAMTRISLAFIALSAAAFPAYAQVYKCVEGGRTIYSQTPCPAGSSQSTTISRRAPSAPAPGAAKSGAPQTTAEQEQAFRKRQQEQQDAAKKDSLKQQEAQEKQQNCSVARSQLAQYQAGGRISRMDSNGERAFLGDAEIDQERARAQAQVDQWCK